jgi:hypothetical protein
MKLFDCRYNYETREEKGVGRIAVTAKDENDAILKVQMIAGADSRCTNCTFRIASFSSFAVTAIRPTPFSSRVS